MALLDSLTAAFSGTDTSGLAALRSQDRSALDLNAFGGALEGFGGFMGSVGHVMYGLDAQRAAKFQAGLLRQAGGQAMAGAERNAFDVQRETDMVTSRALAVAAASGGGASDPTVVNIIARDAAQGAYQKAVALYQGQDRQRLMGEQADAKLYEGRSERLNSAEVGVGEGIGGVASILRSQARGASLYDRFAGSGPPRIPDTGPG